MDAAKKSNPIGTQWIFIVFDSVAWRGCIERKWRIFLSFSFIRTLYWFQLSTAPTLWKAVRVIQRVAGDHRPDRNQRTGPWKRKRKRNKKHRKKNSPREKERKREIKWRQKWQNQTTKKKKKTDRLSAVLTAFYTKKKREKGKKKEKKRERKRNARLPSCTGLQRNRYVGCSWLFFLVVSAGLPSSVELRLYFRFMELVV